MAEPLPRPADPGTVDADNPWPGLASFREADREFFHGREPETRELLRLTLRERLTVLFGLSGLGKTSLLRAGLFPLVRQENLLPVHIRLDFSEMPARLTLAGQVRQAISAAAQDAGIEAPAFPESETLWETLHRQGAELWSPRNRVVTPLLVFDQFEEVFTLGRGNAARIQETEAFLTELADLCEGSVPAALRERLEADPSAARDLSLTRHPYKILLSLREDFLPELEGLRGRIRSIVHNRFRLRRMNGDNAQRVITQAGGHLVEPDVPDRVVRFVAGRDSDSTIPLIDLAIEPALLSVVCRELNNKRRAQGLPRITADLVRGNRDEILSDLYERSVEDLGPEVRSFIEERLLTKSGFRDSVALENAIELPGVTRAALDRLTDRRLLRIEDRGGMQRLELTHDVLTGVIRKSRDLRRAREAERKLRRSRMVIALLALVLIGVVALAVWGFTAQREARKALASSDVQRASNLRAINPAHALAYLARALRSDPESVAAQVILADLLLGRSWPRLTSELRLQALDSVQLSRDGRFFAAVSPEGRARFWDTQTLQQIGEIDQGNAVEFLDISRDGRRILITSPATARLWDIATGQRLGSFELGEKSQALLSPNGQWLALASGDHNLILRRIDTGVERRIVFPAYPPELAPYGGYGNLGFSPDSRRIFAHDNLQILLWDVESGQSLPAPPAGRTTSVSFGPDSRHLLITGDTTTVWELDEDPAARSFGGDATQAWLSPDGEKLVTYEKREAVLRIWDTTDASRTPLVIPKRSLLRAEISRDGQLLLTISESGVELWDAGTGLPVSQPLCDCLEARFVAGRRIVTADDTGVLRTWRSEPARTGTELLDEPANSMYPFFSQDASRFAARMGDRTVRFWDTDTAQPVGAPIRDVASIFLGLNTDGRFLFERSDSLRFWNTQTGRPAWRPIPNPSNDHFFEAAHFNPAQETLGLRSGAATVQLWNLATGRPIREARHDPDITSFAFSPSGDRLATTSSAGGLRIWSSRTGLPLGDEIRHESAVTAFDLSPYEDRVATGTRKGLVRVWDLRSGRLLVGPLAHRYRVSSVRFGRADRALLVSARNLLRLRWDTRTGRRIRGNVRTEGMIWSAELSQDGERLLINAEGDPIRLLDPQTGQTLIGLPIQSGIFTKSRLSPSGQLLWVAVQDKVHVFIVPRFSKNDRDLLADWAEAVSGWTFEEDDRLVEINDQLGRLNALRRRTAGASGGKLEAAPLIRWFLSDPATRPISPVIDLTIEQVIRRHLANGDWCGAAQAFPGHPLLREQPPSSGRDCDFMDKERRDLTFSEPPAAP